MELEFRKSFLRDTEAVRDVTVLKQLRAVLTELEQAATLRQVRGVKKLQGSAAAYRIRLGEYRLGLFLRGNILEVVRLLPRLDIYRYFP